MKMLSVRDVKMAAYMTPWFVPTVAVGVRSFADEVQKRDTPLNVHPEDYILFELGSFDEESGKFILLDSPRQVALASDFVKG